MFLQVVHRHLFQDVYEWAGDLRTVGIEKGQESFCPPCSVALPMIHVTERIYESKLLAQIAGQDLDSAPWRG